MGAGREGPAQSGLRVARAASACREATEGAPGGSLAATDAGGRPEREATARCRAPGEGQAGRAYPPPEEAAPVQPAEPRTSEGPQLLVRGHSLALGAGASDQARTRFTRLVADRLGLEEVNLAVGGAIAHWSTYGDVGDGGYPLVLRGGLGGPTGEPAPGSAAHLPPGSAALLFYGINDVAALGSRMRPYQEALRTILSRTRAHAVFEAEDRVRAGALAGVGGRYGRRRPQLRRRVPASRTRRCQRRYRAPGHVRGRNRCDRVRRRAGRGCAA